jgi:hypothetical protein
MRRALKLVSFAGLALMLVSALLVFNGAVEKLLYYRLASVGTVIWFATVPFWMQRRLRKR